MIPKGARVLLFFTFAFFAGDAGSASEKTARQLVLEDIGRAATNWLTAKSVKCVPKSESQLSVHSRNLTSDLARASRKGTEVIILVGLRNMSEREMPLAVDNWLHEMRTRGGSVQRRIRVDTQAGLASVKDWVLAPVVETILKTVNAGLETAARQWVYYAAGAYDATIDIGRALAKEAAHDYLISVKLNCRG